jgi:hypothetical protein
MSFVGESEQHGKGVARAQELRVLGWINPLQLNMLGGGERDDAGEGLS